MLFPKAHSLAVPLARTGAQSRLSEVQRRRPCVYVKAHSEHTSPDGQGCQLPAPATLPDTRTTSLVEPRGRQQVLRRVRPAVRPGGQPGVHRAARGSLACRKYDKPLLPVCRHASRVALHDRSGPGCRRESKAGPFLQLQVNSGRITHLENSFPLDALSGPFQRPLSGLSWLRAMFAG